LELVHFEILDQFSHSSVEIRRFSPFNQILLGLFDVSYTFEDCVWVVYTHFCFNVKVKYYYETRLKCQINLTKF